MLVLAVKYYDGVLDQRSVNGGADTSITERHGLSEVGCRRGVRDRGR